MKTAKEFFKDYADLIQHEEGDVEYLVDEESFIDAMIEFTKIHVEAALKKASKKSKSKEGQITDYKLTESILNSYSLENIK